MSQDQESFNRELYNLLKVRGYKPVPLNTQNQRVPASQEADVIQFTFVKDDAEFGKVWITVDDTNTIVVYYDSEQQESPNNRTPGVEYDDTWTGFLKNLKKWSQRRQLNFKLTNKDTLGDDMRQREYYKMKSKLGESYHPMGKKASYNDAVPSVKIILQHNRALEEGEQRYRNVAKIYLENTEGERFLAPTTRPGIARVYARHIAEGGVPNDDRWNHIKSICEEYNKMGGFIRATKSHTFNESAQAMIIEGVNHYNNLRETLKKLAGHRGYSNYFESWTPSLMEEEGDDSIADLFVQETMDPRIESAMPILAKLRKPVAEMTELSALEEWASSLIENSLDINDDEDSLVEMEDESLDEEKKGLWANIHAKRERIKKGSGERMRKPGSKGAPSDSDLKSARGESVEENFIGMSPQAVAEEQLDELSTDTVKSYVDKTNDPKEFTGSLQKFMSRGKGYRLAKNKLKGTAKVPATNKDTSVEENFINMSPQAVAEEESSTSGLKAFLKQYPEARDAMYNAVRNFEYAYDAMDHVAGHVLHKMPYAEWAKVKPAFIEWFKKYGLKGDDVNDVSEDLSPEQKRAGQLGPTEKVKNNNIGKLVGANESVEFSQELARIINITKFNG